MAFTSNAQWPEGTYPSGKDLTMADSHFEKDADRVCELLEKDGWGGEGKVFPIRTWVERVKDAWFTTGSRQKALLSRKYIGEVVIRPRLLVNCMHALIGKKLLEPQNMYYYGVPDQYLCELFGITTDRITRVKPVKTCEGVR